MEVKDIVIIVLLAILIIMVLVLLIKRSAISKDMKDINAEQEKRILDDNNRIKESLNNVSSNTSKELLDFKDIINNSVSERLNNIVKTLNEGLAQIKVDITNQASDNFKQTTTTMSDLQERIAAITEAQKNLAKVESTVESFREIIVNKKSRGNFGEFQLNVILEDLFGSEQSVYKIQYLLSNGKQADAMLFLPDPLGHIAIDSKFPYENYKKLYDQALSEPERENAKKDFDANIRKHVNDISSKYIIKGETADQAIMFIPSEAVFAEVQGNFLGAVEYARKNNVWIVSPSTLMAFLETLSVVLKEKERTKGIKKILDQLSALSEDFRRYEERWTDIETHLNTVMKDVTNIRTTTDKITKKFENINNLSLPKEYEEEEEKI